MEALRCLPGVGPKSAQRMAFHLLERDRKGAEHLSLMLRQAVEQIGHCERCRTFSETPICQVCENPRRDASTICVVENPADLFALEQATGYSGHYFVLMGHLSPLDGIGPDDLGLDLLEKRLAEGHIKEVILATNATVEGETTAHFISEMVHARQIQVTRITSGVPLGGELEYVDGGTLSRAFNTRQAI